MNRVLSLRSNTDIVTALDECLAAMKSGASLNECLTRYPRLATQLKPMLETAVGLSTSSKDVPPPPHGLTEGRARVLERARQLRRDAAVVEAQAKDQGETWFGLRMLLRKSVLVTAIASLVLVLLLGQGAAASANSLPGDALYAVKRIREEVQLLLAFNQQAKADLAAQLEARRREEARAIAETSRLAEVTFRGTIERIDGEWWTVSEVDFLVAPETEISGEQSVGLVATVHVRSGSDGTLRAQWIHLDPVTPTPKPQDTPQPSKTPEPTAVPTFTTEPAAPVQPAQPSGPSATPAVTPTAIPTHTRTPTVTPIPPTPVPPREVKVKFQGSIEAMGPDSWTVDGHPVHITAETTIDGRQHATVGAGVTVVAVRKEDGSFRALEITVQPRSQPNDQPFEFQGLIEEFGPAQWVVGGHVLVVGPETRIENQPLKGLLAEVKALRRGDGTLLAQYILVHVPSERIQFEGQIQSLNAAYWVVDEVGVHLDGETLVSGQPAVGAVVEIDGLLLPDGTVLARSIAVQASTSQLPASASQVLVAAGEVLSSTDAAAITLRKAEPTR